MERKFKPDVENYHNMSIPHESSEKVQEALEGFYKKIEEARKEFKIADILIVIKDSVRHTDGEVGSFFSLSQYGSKLNGPSMAAYAYGQTQAEEKEMIEKLMAGKQ